MANGLSLDPIAKDKLLLSNSNFYLQIYFKILRYIYIYFKVVKDLEVHFITVLKFLFIIFLGKKKKKKTSHSLA